MRIIYEADDGTQFDDEWKCEDYEWKINHPHLKDVHCYNEEGKELENLFEEGTYNYSMKIVVPTDEAAKDLQELAHYTGYYYYAHITESGVWVYKENGCDGRFELESKIISIGDKYILHSENGHEYSIEVVNINDFRPPDMKYGCDVYDDNGTYAGDVMFVGEEFFKKCEKVEIR